MTDIQPEKRKNRSPMRVSVNTGGCLLAMFMLVIGGLAGIGGALFVAPGVFGFNVTATALADDRIVLAATAADLDQRDRDADARETAFALDRMATQAALGNDQALLAQTATQSARFIVATETAAAAESARQRTQIALDATATQASLQRDATQIEINFRNTQAALDNAAGVSAQSVATEDASALPPASDTPTITPTPLPDEVNYTFNTGISSAWDVSSMDDWTITDTGLRAERDLANLRLSNNGIADLSAIIGSGASQRIVWGITPAALPDAIYWLSFGLQTDGSGYTIAIQSNNLVASEITLYRVTEAAWRDDGFTPDNLIRLSSATSDDNLVSQTTFTLIIEGNTAQLRLNENPVLASDSLSIIGQGIGAHLPANAILRAVTIDRP